MGKIETHWPVSSRRKIVSLDINTGPYQVFIDRIIELGLIRKSSYVCAANVHMVVEAWRHSDFAKVVNDAEIVTPDGMPLVIALKLLYGISQDRVAGMDLMPDILQAAEKSGCSIYLYGSSTETLSLIGKRIENEYKDLRLAGFFSPPFRPLDMEDLREDALRINNSGAHIVLVALGCPKQERWMALQKGKIKAAMVGVGGAFPVFAGMQKRAPQWMSNGSLEWLYRLWQEPRRLFWRYLTTNTFFLSLIVLELIRKLSVYNYEDRS